ncbi:DEAD/DEAH box helicase family protein, partial [Streptococcus mutans]|nr:DEAD/DEAH box helicase family protein [Streptococcus mutans]
MNVEDGLKFKLYRHQQLALTYMRINNAYALFMEQGTGKTIPSLVRVCELLRSGDIENALVVAPKSALGAWERDIEIFSPSDQRTLKRGLTLINYDKVWRTRNGVNPYDKEWGCIILDEAHSIKNRTSKRSEFILKLATKSKYRYILTGTPIGNGQLENIWALYAFLSPYIERKKVYSHIFGGSYYKFLDKYAVLNKYYQPAKYVNVDELQDIIAQHSYRVVKADCLDLPEKLPDEVVKVDLLEKTYYKKILKDSAILEHEILADNPLSRMLKLRQIASG